MKDAVVVDQKDLDTFWTLIKFLAPPRCSSGGTKQWVLYVLRCKDDTLYCGITNNLPGRIRTHNFGKGARYTKGRGPVVLIKSWPATSMSAALKAERAFKTMTRAEKEKKIRSRSRRDLISLLLLG